MRAGYCLLIFIFLFEICSAQKVGVVLSGGGAKGLAHIGVLKALEENNIPVDYIVGTSMGGIIAGMYAAGYSPYEMEYVAFSHDFYNWVTGEFDSDYKYFFKKKEENASIISLKVAVDSVFQPKLRSNLINDIPLNFALQQLVCQASANARYDFDKLFVPFRCVAADVFSQEQVILRKGSLHDALRATMTVPYIFRPIKVNNRYVFDGGLYNNFPVDVLRNEFNPDVIIGVNVSTKTYNAYPFESDELLVSQLFYNLLLSKSDSTDVGINGIYIQPDLTKYTAFNFKEVEPFIEAGYQATMAKMDDIKASIAHRITEKELNERRKAFTSDQPELIFDDVKVSGLLPHQEHYVQRVFGYKKRQLVTLDDIKQGYYRLVADDNFLTVYPKIFYNDSSQSYKFELEVKPERNFKAEFGGNISSRPANSAFLGLQYNFFTRRAYTFATDFYLGRFYEAAQLKSRIDFPANTPFYLESELTYNHWDFFKSSQIFLEDLTPTFIDQSDANYGLSLGFPVQKGKLILQTSYAWIQDKFTEDELFKSGDTLDVSNLNIMVYRAAFEKNTFDQKQFPHKGERVLLDLKYINGKEIYFPGTTAIRTLPQKNGKAWLQAKLSYENYLPAYKFYTLGYLLEGLVSDQPFFATYRSSILRAPGFYPLIDSKTLFLENYRSFSYAAVGIKNIFHLLKSLDLRLEGYVFQPHKVLIPGPDQQATFAKPWKFRYYSGTAALVYNSPLGPISLNFNYYDDPKKTFGVMFNVGYLMFNKRPTD